MASTGDPVADLILGGEAAELDEAEEMYLDRSLDEIVRIQTEILRSRGGLHREETAGGS